MGGELLELTRERLDSMGGRMSDERTALAKLASQATATLLRELVAHLRQNRTHLREEWVHRMGLGDRRASHKGRGAGENECGARAYRVARWTFVCLANVARSPRSVGTPQKASPRLACPSARLRHPSDAATQTHPVHSNHNENVAGEYPQRVPRIRGDIVVCRYAIARKRAGRQWHPTC
jgi:hypothetical protein